MIRHERWAINPQHCFDESGGTTYEIYQDGEWQGRGFDALSVLDELECMGAPRSWLYELALKISPAEAGLYCPGESE